MKKTLSAIFVLAATAFAVSCSSDNGGSNKGDTKKTKTEFVSVTPQMGSAAEHDFAEGDVMYACNGSIGEKGVVCILRYDAASGQFKGNLQYASDDDKVNCYVKYANTPKVEVDTASRTITVDYQNQDGTLAGARQRDYAYNITATAASLTNPAQPLTLHGTSAFLNIKKAAGADAKGYRLTSAGNRIATKTSMVSEPMVFASSTVVHMNTNWGVIKDNEKISCSVNTGGDTYVAFHAHAIAEPVLECEVTLESGVNIIENVSLEGEGSQSSGDTQLRITSFDNGKTYTATATGKVSAGTFLCDAQFNAKAIVYDTENINEGKYRTARAMAVSEAESATAWCNAETLPSSASKYVTSSVMTDLRGYEVSNYFRGNADYAAINAASNYPAALQGCSAWYLPSAGEWINFWNNLGGKNKINLLLRQAGANELTGAKYWTTSLRGLTEPYAMMESDGSLSPIAQPLHSKNAVRASIIF